MALRAAACAATVTPPRPSTFEKNPGAGFVIFTLIVSFATTALEKLMPDESSPPPFLFAYCTASAVAVAGESGSPCAPARAAASAVCCRALSARYQEPTSRTRAAMPQRTTRNTTVSTVAWPRVSFAIVIPRAP